MTTATMTEREAFEAAIKANPNDHAPRLAFADWLQERGDDVEAARQRELAPLRERIDAFVAHVTRLTAEHWTTAGYTHALPHTLRADFISAKWCRIVRQETAGGTVYCFIALQDYANRGLGSIRAGDIHMAAGWKKPAKHARGSVFSEDFDKCAGVYGVAYLRR